MAQNNNLLLSSAGETFLAQNNDLLLYLAGVVKVTYPANDIDVLTAKAAYLVNDTGV
ncbi:hypothetical protein [Ktedonospora formicarum]|uniref:Uncharacterized protein n=1 Tax=Ktedonospora formicarum TaxID=2778364 RepID=A0A8J3HQF0_9CHLR|nr:hypothetical protein [Ktedonospora formicarum]GHO41882.1 hypothetical protein KSX_00450 [Ktedonospora formicarum]